MKCPSKYIHIPNPLSIKSPRLPSDTKCVYELAQYHNIYVNDEQNGFGCSFLVLIFRECFCALYHQIYHLSSNMKLDKLIEKKNTKQIKHREKQKRYKKPMMAHQNHNQIKKKNFLLRFHPSVYDCMQYTFIYTL